MLRPVGIVLVVAALVLGATASAMRFMVRGSPKLSQRTPPREAIRAHEKTPRGAGPRSGWEASQPAQYTTTTSPGCVPNSSSTAFRMRSHTARQSGKLRRYGFCLVGLARIVLARASISVASETRPVLRNKSA